MKDASYDHAQHLAERVRDTMLATDRVAQTLGMQVSAISPGHASVTMVVREDMLNGFGSCHGGLLATLADMAFAYACNSYNEMTVASGFDVDLLGPGKLGETLTADARVVSQGARMGVYDITVTNTSGERIAVFRGRSYRLKGKQVVPT
ncbi:MAG: hydroxyphenylacetyl-CoA thioesterase PaaI [Piscinibacter sp.]|jgi:acyl-CoA thioesterase|uniref:hydroxyphenylacetyl-CoA thioesterase PaaI n=1 Tax=Piscinibacter sp. TaxID=1903157 RepID=UPI0035B2A96B